MRADTDADSMDERVLARVEAGDRVLKLDPSRALRRRVTPARRTSYPAGRSVREAEQDLMSLTSSKIPRFPAAVPKSGLSVCSQS